MIVSCSKGSASLLPSTDVLSLLPPSFASGLTPAGWLTIGAGDCCASTEYIGSIAANAA
jgi:hypothetical protein